MPAFSQWLGWHPGIVRRGISALHRGPVHNGVLCPQQEHLGIRTIGRRGSKQAKQNLPDLLRARPGIGTVSLLVRATQSPPNSAGISWQVWLDGGIAGRCLWRLRPLCLCPCRLFGTMLRGFPRSLMFSFPNEFLVRLARAHVQPGCSSSGEHPSSDDVVCPNSQGH